MRLDALRGLLLVLMTMRHCPAFVGDYTLQYLGFLSEAEGFVFLSGYVAGIAFTRASLHEHHSVVWRRALLRTRTIYLYHFSAFILLFFVIRAYVGDQPFWDTWTRLFTKNTGEALTLGAALLYQPRFLDILPMYCIFLITTPVIILHFKHKRYSSVLLFSILLWSLAQFGFGPGLLQKYWTINLGAFDIFAWQLLFVAGLFFGHIQHTDPDKARFPSGALCSALVISVGLFLCRHEFLLTGSIRDMAFLASKPTLGPLRLLNFSAFAILIAQISTRLKSGVPISCLAYLGRHSLEVFTFHIVIVTSINLILQRDTGVGGWNEVVLATFCILVLFVPAAICEFAKSRTSRSRVLKATISAHLTKGLDST